MAVAGELSLMSAISPTPNFNGCYDASEMDAYINFEPVYPSPSLSPSAEAKSVHPTPSSQPFQPSNTTPSPVSNSNTFGSSIQPSQQVSFSAPSHQYGSYQQQTGLPMGGLANTMPLNPGPSMRVGFNDLAFGQPDSFGLINRPADVLSMNTSPMLAFPHDSTDLDLESDPAGLSQGTMLSSQSSKTQFVDPNAVGGQELSPVAPPAQVGRVYPGIHQQQAARARAAQQQRQQEMIRRQQQHQLAQGQPQPSVPQGHSRQSSRSQQGKVSRPVDPLVEERISRLLQQMRQNSVVVGDEQSGAGNSLPQPTKHKKDEQDMDEDERLLASEEGKKLSSKERRQLRNKVSARAFRSRRKEYIGQLEGEVTVKTNEANELRIQNQALMQENARLGDLTRMLLSSPHFASFLNDISVNGLPPLLQKAPLTNQTHMPADMSSDAKAPQLSQEVEVQNTQTVVPSIAEEPFDFASMDSGWNSGIDINFTNPTVLAVLDVPEGPFVDPAVLSGKNSISVGLPSADEAKSELPALPLSIFDSYSMEEANEPHCPAIEVDVDENDPSFALYLDQPNSESKNEPFGHPFRGPEIGKASARYDLVVATHPTDQHHSDHHALRQFKRLQASVEGAYQRISRVTSHLD
ncbi:predicted protein [Uncinocarpus reesii 1704]|uniref:BZIP domain-containing protein n=1 Tax=Uncinocarpus reesii (strain UAMH 1704) TaxID=336963 RepID=C4JIP9_UNCRE|nr:uncharacterized protein UREG_02910 [Uncinocarpus reesii 1704]EEP78061.1 predicted protein [Uncinocarpus reesii 1704]